MRINLLLAIVFNVIASNILHAQSIYIELIYKQLPEDSIEIQLIKYFDCETTGISDEEKCQVLENQTFLFQKVISLKCTGQKDTIIFANSGCINISRYCLKKVVYSGKIQNNHSPGGLLIVYAEKNKSELITNIITEKPESYFIISTTIPQFGENNQNSFKTMLPIYQCIKHPYTFYYEPIDDDNDSIILELNEVSTLREERYEEAVNLTGKDIPIPLDPPYEVIRYKEGCSAANPFNSGEFISIKSDNSCSFYTTEKGNYLIGLTVKEFRKQNVISERKMIFISKSIN
ncbi:MAG: hypothetical protein GX437_07985 [Sphingobacteriales bacterium]|nr:hypothetical protein [Sphingobacteriales bacterium]